MKKSIILLMLLTIMLLTTISAVIAANDPGHDTLYIEETGNSSLTGSLNVSSQLQSNIFKMISRFFGDYIDVKANGTITTPTVPAIQAGTNTMYIDSPGNIYINTKAGTSATIQVGDTATNGVTFNVSGSITQQGTAVCLSDGTNCISGTNEGNVSSVTAGDGISVTGTDTDPVINLATGSAGTGLAYSSGILSVNAGTGLTTSGDNIIIDDTTVCTSGNGLCDSTGLWTNSSGNATYSAGNVGIGTTTPGEALEVDGNINASGTINSSSDVCISGGTCLSDVLSSNPTLANVLIAGNSAGSTSLNMNGQDILSANNVQVNGQISHSSGATVTINDAIQVNGPGASAFTGNVSFDSGTLFVDSTNNYVGIGTTSPTSKIDALTTITDGSSTTAYRLRNDFSASTGNVATTQNGAFFSMYSAGDYNHTSIRSLVGSSYNNGPGNIINLAGATFGGGALSTGNITNFNAITASTYGTGDGVIGSAIGLRVLDLGAYNSPTSMYGVYITPNTGSVGTSKFGLYIGDQSGASNNNYAIYSLGGDNYFAGNVGIGTASPTEELVVGDDLGSIGSGANIVIGDASATPAFAIGENSSERALISYDRTNDYLAFSTRKSGTVNSNTLVLKNGKVGVNLATPTTTFAVRPHTVNAGITVTESDSNANAIVLLANTVRGSISVLNSGNVVATINGAAVDSYINTGGDFGIGNANPNATLHVSGEVIIESYTNYTETDGNVIEYSNGCYQKVNSTGVYMIC